MYLTNLANVARSAGLVVIEQPGWKTRGHGPQTDVHAVVCHHTGTRADAPGDYPSLNTVQNGRTGLAGPLSHLGLGRSGTVYVIAAGMCYHAGVVRSPIWENDNTIGIEAEGSGSDPWPELQMDAYARLCRALQREYGNVPVLGHKEVCAPVGRKVDPNFDMNTFRARVAAVGIGGGGAAPVGEDELMVVSGPPTVGDDYGVLHVPVDGKQFLRIATSYGHQAKIGMTMIDDTGGAAPVGVTGKVVDADRPGPWDLSKAHAGFANFSHVVVQYQCDGPVTAWTNNRG